MFHDAGLRLRNLRRRATLISALLGSLGLSACDTVSETVALTAGITVGATVIGANIPAHEIEQNYYLGVFDPQEQIPPTIYRVRVHGQASVYSSTKFASGWVPAQVIDSLSSHVGFAVNDPAKPGVRITPGNKEDIAKLTPGRRLVQFGPEGFREAPKDHRLVIVMGASPQAFFQAIDQALGSVGGAIQAKQDAELKGELFKALVLLRAQRDRLDDLSRDVDLELLRTEQADTNETEDEQDEGDETNVSTEAGPAAAAPAQTETATLDGGDAIQPAGPGGDTSAGGSS